MPPPSPASTFARRAVDVRSARPREARTVGVCPALLVATSLPHREPRGPDGRPATSHVTVNGDARMVVRAGAPADGEASDAPLGVPYGAVARLLLIHLATAASRRGCRDVDLGASLAAFLRSLDLSTSGGAHGRPRYVVDQLRRLLGCVVTTERVYHVDGCRVVDGDTLVLAEQYRLWTRGPGAGHATAVLGDRFFDHVTRRGVPVDLRKIAALRSSSLALDLYVWLTYRARRLAQTGRPSVAVRWRDLHDQFGGGYRTDESGTKEFARSARRALDRIRVLWPELDVVTPPGRLVLRTTRPDVAARPSVHA